MASQRDLHNRDISDDAFYEWLLSDHPDALTERSRRRAACYKERSESAAKVRSWAGVRAAGPDTGNLSGPAALHEAGIPHSSARLWYRSEARHGQDDSAFI